MEIVTMVRTDKRTPLNPNAEIREICINPEDTEKTITRNIYVIRKVDVDTEYPAVWARGSSSLVYIADVYRSEEDKKNGKKDTPVIMKEIYPLSKSDDGFLQRDGDVIIDPVPSVLEPYIERAKAEADLINGKIGDTTDLIPYSHGNVEANGTFYFLSDYKTHYFNTLQRTALQIGVKEILTLCLYLLRSLDDFHRNGYLHLDIKPDNIIVMEWKDSKGIHALRLIDFNSAHECDDDGILSDDAINQRSITSNRGFSPPEVRAASKGPERYDQNYPVCFASDLYSVVAVMYWLFFNDFFTRKEAMIKVSERYERVRPDILHKIEKIFTVNLSDHVDERRSFIQELYDDIKAVLKCIDEEADALASDEKYEGEWKDDKYDGYGKYSCPDYTYEGEWKDGTRHGQGKIIYSGGETYDGGWQYDKYSGMGTAEYPSGEKYVGHWKVELHELNFGEAKRDGHGIATYPSGVVYEGNWKNSRYDHYGTLYFPNGRKYKGLFKDSKFHGYGELIAPDGSIISKGVWANNSLIREEKGDDSAVIGTHNPFVRAGDNNYGEKIWGKVEEIVKLIRRYGSPEFSHSPEYSDFQSELREIGRSIDNHYWMAKIAKLVVMNRESYGIFFTIKQFEIAWDGIAGWQK